MGKYKRTILPSMPIKKPKPKKIPKKKIETFGLKVNKGIFATNLKEKDVMGTLFTIGYQDFELMSVSAIKDRMRDIIDIIQTSNQNLPSNIKKTIKTVEAIITDVDDKEKLLTFITNMILASEGLGLLYGFGACICEKNEDGGRTIRAQLYLNPEKQTLRSPY